MTKISSVIFVIIIFTKKKIKKKCKGMKNKEHSPVVMEKNILYASQI